MFYLWKIWKMLIYKPNLYDSYTIFRGVNVQKTINITSQVHGRPCRVLTGSTNRRGISLSTTIEFRHHWAAYISPLLYIHNTLCNIRPTLTWWTHWSHCWTCTHIFVKCRYIVIWRYLCMCLLVGVYTYYMRCT